MNIVVMRDEEGRVIEAWTDGDAEVTLHFADLDHTEAQPGTLKMFQEQLVDHWTMSVHNDSEVVQELFGANAPVTKAPLAPQQGMCQFCGEPATIVTGGITACEQCDGPPTPRRS